MPKSDLYMAGTHTLILDWARAGSLLLVRIAVFYLSRIFYHLYIQFYVTRNLDACYDHPNVSELWVY